MFVFGLIAILLVGITIGLSVGLLLALHWIKE